MPLRHRCEYAAALSSQPPWRLMPTAAGVPHQPPMGARRFQPMSTRFRAGA